MHEETNFAEQFKKNAKRSKPPPSLSIPDPVDIFKLEQLNRPPSVPILGRRLSSESHLNNKDRNSPILNSRLPFRQFRRKSIPDRLHKKSSIVTKKSEGKLKVPQKYPDTKPPLDKSSKLLKVKSSKTLIKKSNLSTPHLNKVKKTMNKLLGGEFLDKRKFDNNTPNKVMRKNSDGKEFEDIRRNQFEPRNLIVKRTSENFNKPEKLPKPVHKSSRSALSMGLEDRVKESKKKSKKMLFVDNNRVSPPKKRTGKKSEGAERSSSQSKINKKRKKSKKSGKKTRKQSSEGKPKHTKEPKKIVIKQKIPKPPNEIKEDLTEKWLEHSFFMNSKNKQVESLEFDYNLYEDQVINFNVSDLQSSNEARLNFSIPSSGGWLSKISSVPILSVPDTKGNRPKSPIPTDLERSNRVKIFKKSANLQNKSEILKKAAICIQRVFRGYKTRKLISEDRKKVIKNEENYLFLQDYSLINKEPDKLSLNDSKEKEHELKFQNSIEIVHGSFEENTEKSDYQAPKPAEIITDPQLLSPVNNGVLLKMTELTKRIKQEQKNYEILERDSKEVENLLYLDTLKQKKASIEDLRKRDLEAIKKLTPNNGSETQIFDIFQNIINRRYETINSMFDENIKAVQDALSQPVLLSEETSVKIDERVFKCKDMPLQTSETTTLSAGFRKNKNEKKVEENKVELGSVNEELSVKAVDFSLMKENNRHEARFYKNLEKCANKVNIDLESTARSPEALCSYLVFRNMPQSSKPIYQDPEVPRSKPRSKPEAETLGHSSKIVWIDEVAMPSSIDLTDILIESSISELYQYLLSDIISDLFKISSQFIQDLSEELVMAILVHEIQEQVQEMRKDYDEESILTIIQKVFIKTQNLIVTELLKPLEKDPLLVLSEIQESEIGCGFLPEEKYAMLNWEAFQDELSDSKISIKIFNTMVFDCINECLERLIVKEDLPWATVKYKKILVRTSEDVVNYIVNRLIKFSEIRAGEILYEEIGNDSKKSERENVQKRESDIVKMLAIEVVEDEMEWVKYDKEELQARLDLADMILEQEIDGIVEILFGDN